jgi:ABC-2 type transport system permease protein
MNTSQTIPNTTLSKHALKPTLQFAAQLLYANLRNWKALAITLGMPFFMLFSFWVPSLGGDAESKQLMQLLFPAIILLSAIMPGLTQATRLTRWREQHIFQRFALTPVPLANLMLGTAFTQILIGVGQGLLMLLFGVLLVKLNLSALHMLAVLGTMMLAGAAFIAFGSLIAAFCRKSDIAGYMFFFSVMPLIFLASFPPEMLPESINAVTPWLPTSMAIEIIGPLFLYARFSDGALLAAAGLVAYTALFTLLSTRLFRWEA